MTEPPIPDAAPPEPAPPTDGLASVVLVDPRDDVAGVCGYIDAAPTFAVVLHAPDGNRQLASQLGMRRLVRHAEDTGRVIAIATRSRALAARARQLGVPVGRRPEKVRWDAGGRRVLWLGPVSIAFPGVSRYLQFAVLALAALIAAAATLTIGPHASITIAPPVDEHSGTFVLSGVVGAGGADYEALQFPAIEVSTTRNVTLAVATTGIVQAPSGRATVLVTLANTGGVDITIPEGAVILSSTGPPFVLDQETTVPAGKTVIQQASATEPGPAGNVPAQALGRWESPAYSAVRVSNAGPAAGGGTEERPGVAPTDIAALEDLARRLGESDEWLRALTGDRPGDAIFSRTATVEISLGDPALALGQPGPVVFAEVTVRITARAIPRHYLAPLLERSLGTPPPGPLLTETIRAVETGRRQRDGPGSALMSEFRLSGAFSRATPGDVRDLVKGKSEEDARSTLLERYGIQDADVTLTPGFMPWLPRFHFRIDVTFQVPEDEPAPPSPTPDAQRTPTPTPPAPTPTATPGP